jgi:hypothetical protein
MQNVDVTQETCPLNPFGPVVTALGTTDQFEALTCADTVRPCGLTACAPADSIRAMGNANRAIAHPAVRTRSAAFMTASLDATCSATKVAPGCDFHAPTLQQRDSAMTRDVSW